jgi:glycosyltransferase involved in cell wall biosynthesis
MIFWIVAGQNGVGYLDRYIASMGEQTYSAMEFIVIIGGGSKDTTVEK